MAIGFINISTMMPPQVLLPVEAFVFNNPHLKYSLFF
jgi:hypothetical protein